MSIVSEERTQRPWSRPPRASVWYRHTFALVLLAAATATAAAAGDQEQPGGPPIIVTRQPTGPFAVGVTSWHLVDRSRPELATPAPDDVRELMVQVWYPARAGRDVAAAPYFLDENEGRLNAEAGGIPPNAFSFVFRWALRGAPLSRARRSYPVVLFSPGLQTPVALYTSIVEDLASHGYVVVAISHPYSTGVTVFPDDRVAYAPDVIERLGPATLHAIWVDDAQFVLDRLERLNNRKGRGFGGRLNLRRVGMLGHSFGGAAAAGLAMRDPRIRAAVNIDGTFHGSLVEHGIDQPFMLINSEQPFMGPTRETFLSNLRGTGYDLVVAGSGHNNFSDQALLLPLAQFYVPGLTPDMLGLGPIDGLRALDITTSYVRAFLDWHLLGRPSELLAGASAEYPEVLLSVFNR